MNKRKIRIYMIIFSFALILFIIGGMRLIKNVETVNPKFPEKYDVVIIDHGQECWIMDDKEDIERFIKASKRVSEHVGEAPDWYILRFVFDHKQVFSIPYDDISYSQEAADIINSYIHNKKRYFHYKEKEAVLPITLIII